MLHKTVMVVFIFLAQFCLGQNVFGNWLTVDGNTGIAGYLAFLYRTQTRYGVTED